MPGRAQPPEWLVSLLGQICLGLPDALEVEAWTGTSWRIRDRTFAHVVQIADGWPPAYATAARTAGPASVVTFQADADERRALVERGEEWFVPPWRPGLIGVVVTDTTDWTELSELIIESYCLLAPRHLAESVHADGESPRRPRGRRNP